MASLHFVRSSVDFGELYDLDDDGWLAHDGTIGRAADSAMKAVDAETVGLFRKYGLEMPATFARDTQWKRIRRPFDESLPYVPALELEDRRQARQLAAIQSQKDRQEVREAILATDARRTGALPKDYYRVS